MIKIPSMTRSTPLRNKSLQQQKLSESLTSQKASPVKTRIRAEQATNYQQILEQLLIYKQQDQAKRLNFVKSAQKMTLYKKREVPVFQIKKIQPHNRYATPKTDRSRSKTSMQNVSSMNNYLSATSIPKINLNVSPKKVNEFQPFYTTERQVLDTPTFGSH